MIGSLFHVLPLAFKLLDSARSEDLSSDQWKDLAALAESILGASQSQPGGSAPPRWPQLIDSGFSQTLLKVLSDTIPPGTEDIQSEARRLGDLMPGEATTLAADDVVPLTSPPE